MPRFFVSPREINAQFMVLTGENAAHAKVLRLKNGDEVTVCDGSGTDYRCTVSDIAAGQISLVVHEAAPAQSEAGIECAIYMAFAKADKFEHVIQKATELGAAELVCFPSSRCVSRPDERSLEKKLDRWQKIAASAAEQSGRGLIPEVLVLGSYAEALRRAAQADKALLFYEHEDTVTLHDALDSGHWKTVSLLTGPEGGLEEREVSQALDAGLTVCTLGKRILRCETAPLCALSAVMYAAGEY